MKDGQLIEIGTHQELMAKQGEYYALYGVQARAFTEPGAPETPPDLAKPETDEESL